MATKTHKGQAALTPRLCIANHIRMRGIVIFSALGAIMTGQLASAQMPARPPSAFDRLVNLPADSLMQIFGPPTQDAQEGPARRLQFAGSACILDVYLYPPADGAEPRVAYASARVADGREADRNLCITLLRLQR